MTDVEVYQEILHRYRAIDRLPAADDAFVALDRLVDEVFPLDRDDVIRA